MVGIEIFMTKPIRTAIFGSGFMGRVHLEALRRVEHLEIAAIAGRNTAAADKLGSALDRKSVV